MRTTHLFAVAAAVSLSASSAMAASKITVTAECQDPGFSSFNYGFRIRYENPALADGTKVELVKGFSGKGSINSAPSQEKISWAKLETLPMTVRLQDGKREALSSFRLFYMATGGHLSDLDFAIKLTQPDGAVTWENGGNLEGYQRHHYRTPIFRMNELECWQLDPPADLVVEKVQESE